ncbi:MAG: class I SAM-dependent methyltransferase [Mariniblastus sp.]
MNTPEPNKSSPNFPPSQRSKSSAWQIPNGVSTGNWDYVRANQIAAGYDDFLNGDPLSTIDRQIINHYLPAISNEQSTSPQNKPPIVADFGCGTGRTLLPLLKSGYRGVAIDLSIPMLAKLKEKFEIKISNDSKTRASDDCTTTQVQGDLLLLQANLVELDGLADNSLDHGISLFSTLGMIQGSNHRSSFLNHVRRSIKPGGNFILHAHNAWFQLRHPGGIPWAASSVWSHLRGASEFGDRTASYRGVNQMFIHSFRKSELKRALSEAGFENQKWFGILPGSEIAVEYFPTASAIRLVGWIVVCQ